MVVRRLICCVNVCCMRPDAPSPTHQKCRRPTWYERLRTARTALYADTTPAGRLALGALKYTYALTISGFNSAWQRDKRSPLYRPD